MIAFEDALFAYVAAWSETDEQQRRKFLEKSWAENGLYIDPAGEAPGREALVHYIGKFLHNFPDYRFMLTSSVTQHHGWFRFTWALVKPDGTQRMEGADFGKVGPDGRILGITGFFGPLPPVPSSWSADLVYKRPDVPQKEVLSVG